MASMSTPIPTSSPSFYMFQKPMIITHGSLALQLPSMSKVGRVRCSMESKPAITSDDGAKFPFPEGKSSWPELVGVNGEVAAAIIEKENPKLFALVLSADSPVTQDFVFNRVRVFVNSEGVVVQTPVIG